MAGRQTRSRYQQIVRPNHLSARLKFRPNAGVNACLRKVKCLNRNGGKNLFNVPLPPRFAPGVLRAFHAVQKFGSGNGGDYGLDVGKLPEKTRHVEFASFVCNEQRAVEDQSHADLSGGRMARACSMSSAKALASFKGSFSNALQRSANSPQVRDGGAPESSNVNKACPFTGNVSAPQGCTRPFSNSTSRVL